MSRDSCIDFLRVIGTMSVIMAHVSPPTWLYQIRAFDVVLLVLISGMSFTLSTAHRREYSFLSYLYKRIKRLLFPTYVCITVLFVLCYVFCYILKRNQLYSFEDIAYSYILSDHGMGYIWIVKVYLLIALLTPVINKIDKSIKDENFTIAIYISLLIIQHFLLRFNIVKDWIIFSDYLVYIIPYCIASWIGIRWNTSTSKFKMKILVLSLIATSVFCLQYGFVPNKDKFPPDWFYFCYGIVGGISMIRIASYISPYITTIDNKGFVRWLSQNSFNLYLCHIIVMLAYNMLANLLNIKIFDSFLFHYIIILLVSILFTYIIDIYDVKKRNFPWRLKEKS